MCLKSSYFTQNLFHLHSSVGESLNPKQVYWNIIFGGFFATFLLQISFAFHELLYEYSNLINQQGTKMTREIINLIQTKALMIRQGGFRKFSCRFPCKWEFGISTISTILSIYLFETFDVIAWSLKHLEIRNSRKLPLFSQRSTLIENDNCFL